MIYYLVCGTLGVLFSLLGHLVHVQCRDKQIFVMQRNFCLNTALECAGCENNAMPIDRHKIGLDASKVDREREFLTTELESKL
jgi:hypothetical protein